MIDELLSGYFAESYKVGYSFADYAWWPIWRGFIEAPRLERAAEAALGRRILAGRAPVPTTDKQLKAEWTPATADAREAYRELVERSLYIAALAANRPRVFAGTSQELFQIAAGALAYAALTWDPDRGATLWTYAGRAVEQDLATHDKRDIKIAATEAPIESLEYGVVYAALIDGDSRDSDRNDETIERDEDASPSRAGLRVTEDIALWKVFFEQLAAAAGCALSQHEKHVYRALYVDGLKVPDAARALHCSYDDIYRTGKRIVDKLRQELGVDLDALDVALDL